VTVALYATIWLALALLVVAEARKRARGAASAIGWAWRCYAAGALLCLAHLLLAFHLRHGWSHAAASADIARRTEELFGLAWTGGIWVNYVFAGLWLAGALWWSLDPAGYSRRPPALVWLVRGFAFVVIFNAAVVFASAAGRMAGAPLVAALAWTWRSTRRG
jgi:hypothetical protein